MRECQADSDRRSTRRLRVTLSRQSADRVRQLAARADVSEDRVLRDLLTPVLESDTMRGDVVAVQLTAAPSPDPSTVSRWRPGQQHWWLVCPNGFVDLAPRSPPKRSLLASLFPSRPPSNPSCLAPLKITLRLPPSVYYLGYGPRGNGGVRHTIRVAPTPDHQPFIL
jgi:hypothetical protein